MLSQQCNVNIFLITKQNPMPDLPEINAKVDELQAALDLEQQQVADLLAQNAATIATLTETIAALEASGGTEAERQAVLDKLNALKADLEATVAP